MSEPSKAALHTVTVNGLNNIVVQISGHGNSVTAGPTSSLNLLKLTGSNSTSPSPAGELAPYRRRCPFLGRQQEIKELRSWLDDDGPILLRTLVGPAGIGKTRLAIELMEEASDWASGFVTNYEIERFVTIGAPADWAWADDTLVVVDYAEEKADHLARWVSALSERFGMLSATKGKLRILLLAREAETDSGWYTEVFGDLGKWSDERRFLCNPTGPVEVLSIADAETAIAILADTQDRLSPQSSREAPYKLFEGLTRSADADQLVGNPLMLQIAATEAAHAGSAPNLSRLQLLDAVVKREISRLQQDWKKKNVPKVIWKPLQTIHAIVNLLHRVDVEQLFLIIDSFPSLSLLRKSIDNAKVLEVFNPMTRPDGVSEIHRLEPDLLANLFIVRSSLTDSDISMACNKDPYTVGGRLIQILNDLSSDKHIENIVIHWIDVAATAPLKPISLDIFHRRISMSSSPSVDKIRARVACRLTAALKAGANTAETLLTAPADRNNVIARSLLVEAQALISQNLHSIALEKITEAKSLYRVRNIEDSLGHQIIRINLEVECVTALNQNDTLTSCLDEGIQLCNEAIKCNLYTPGLKLTRKARKLVNKFEPNIQNVLTARGVEAALPSFSIRDIRFNKANFVLRRIMSKGYPQKEVITAVYECDRALRGWKYKYFRGLELFYEAKYRTFSRAGDSEYGSVFRSAQRNISKIRQGFRGDALQLLLGLQKFVIHAYLDTQMADRREAIGNCLSSLYFALDQKVEMRARHLIELIICLLAMDGSHENQIAKEIYIEAFGAASDLDKDGHLAHVRRALTAIAQLLEVFSLPALDLLDESRFVNVGNEMT